MHGGFDEGGRRSRRQSAGGVVDGSPDTSAGVAELRAAADDDLGLRDSTGYHDQRGPSGVGATPECRGPPAVTGAGGHHLRLEGRLAVPTYYRRALVHPFSFIA